MALAYPACTKLLGPVVPGTSITNGARVPGTAYELDPVQAAFNLGTIVRWLDFNDTWLAAEWGHPSDDLGGILGRAGALLTLGSVKAVDADACDVLALTVEPGVAEVITKSVRNLKTVDNSGGQEGSGRRRWNGLFRNPGGMTIAQQPVNNRECEEGQKQKSDSNGKSPFQCLARWAFCLAAFA